jgi:hypothetical protein
VPARSAPAPPHGLSSGKDFLVANAVEAMVAQPKKKPIPDFNWTLKPDYGKVPEYLQQVE